MTPDDHAPKAATVLALCFLFSLITAPFLAMFAIDLFRP
jgi:hypothetical protein